MRAVITLAIMSASIMELLDTSIVNVAMPDMMGNLGATLDEIGWVATGYIISNVIVLPLTGWLSDFFGRKLYLTYSVTLFTLASLGCGMSHTLTQLVIWRILQGAGGAAFLSTAQATLMEIYPPERRGFAQAVFGVGVVMAPTLGPTVGGWITDTYSWPWIFFINLPIGIIATALTLLFVPDSPAAGERRNADFLGIAFLAVGLGSLQTVLERGESEDWFQTTYITVLTITAALGMTLFTWWQLNPKNTNPAVNLRILKNRNVASGTIFAFALGFVLYGAIFALPQFLQNVQSHTPAQAGLLLMPGGLASMAMMPIIARTVNRVDKRLIIFAGMGMVVLSMLQFRSIFTLTTPDETIYWPLILRGAGTGLQFAPLSLITLGTLAPQLIPQGSGLFNLSRQLGGSFGIAVLATMVDNRMHFHYARLVEHMSPFSPITQERLAMLQTGLQGHGLPASTAKFSAYKAIYGTVMRQSAVMTYMDVFQFMAWMGMGAILLLLLFKPSRGVVRAPGGH